METLQREETAKKNYQNGYTAAIARLTSRGMDVAAREGRIVGMAPLGYRNSWDYPDGKTAIFDERAPLVKRAWELAADGWSLGRILTEVSKAGLTGRNGKPITLPTLHQILKNPFYAGLIRYKGELYQGNHEPLISKELYEKVQNRISAA